MEGWKKAPEHFILFAARQHNILTITSKCNVHCIFCSHRQNPPGVTTYYVEELSLEQVKEYAEYLDGTRKIIIGESATKISEGEPFTHPEIIPVLQYLRRRFPRTPLQLTTNGSLLTPEIIAELVKLSPVELYLSLNSVSRQGRLKLMADRRGPGQGLLKMLAEAGLAFHGSLVAMPWIVGWEDLHDTVLALDRSGAKTIRIFLPGYTRLAPAGLRFPPGLWEQLSEFVVKHKQQISTPLTLEPPHLADLNPEVGGVIKGSPAAEAGLWPGDVILAINNEPPFSRVDAFHKLLAAGKAEIHVRRGKEQFALTLIKNNNEPSGLVMEYDLSREEAETIIQNVRKAGAGSPLLLASQAGYRVVKESLQKIAPEAGVEVQQAANDFFGGSIITAGLLTVEDFQKHWLKMGTEAKNKYDLLVLPAKAFDHRGQDLTGRSYWELQELTGIPVIII
ncbi:DUF512 domain-containing protein [Zhaonella formicivorans]|uniref:DUF512 domain-containing protein n=1 Tax=Zhaonella formicivorans TaxID=2528593 RepID=UPI0010DEC0BB|nr:DUF512 domain-containing protein [Zhaonella formicivorans]